MRSLVSTLMPRRRTDRDRATNQAPVPYASRTGLSLGSLFGSGDPGDRETQLRAMGGCGTLFSIVSRTSTATAKPHWRLYRKAASGQSADRIEVTSHAALDLWNRPNPHYKSRRRLVEAGQQHVDLTGEGWIVVYRNPMSTIPLELWPVRPDRMEPVQDPKDFVVGYIYRGPSGEEVPLGLDEVMRIIVPHPLDPYRGMGAVQTILTDLDASRYSAEWNRNFFLNSAEPGGIIEVERRLEDEEFDEMRDRWREQHRGVANAHRVAILEQGKWVDRKFTQRDMQFAELRNVSRDVIREAFGASKFVLGDVDDVNRATAEAAMAEFALDMTVPRLDRWKDMLNDDLLPMFGPSGEGLEFDYDSPVPSDAETAREDMTAKASAAQVYVETGWEPESVKTALALPDALVWAGNPGQPQPAPGQANRWDRIVSGLVGNGYDHDHDHQVVNEIPPELALVQADWSEQLDTTTTDAQVHLEEQDQALVDAIMAALAANALLGLIGIVMPSTGLADVLTQAMMSMASTAAGRMVDEAADQGAKISKPLFTATRFANRAEVAATLAQEARTLGAVREALRLSGYGDGYESYELVEEGVQSYLGALSIAPLTRSIGGMLTWAQNVGRIDTLRGKSPTSIRATEVLDSNTCGPCRKIDGIEFTDLAAAMLAYGGGGYWACEGMDRCRGTVVATW